MGEPQREDKTVTGAEELFIPFGRFVHGGQRDEHSDPMVGRDGIRNFLIEQLTYGPPHGATLITGRRGVGKTSLVRFCLKQYEKNVNARGGRGFSGISWVDLAIAVVVIAAGALTLVLAAILFSNMTGSQPPGLAILLVPVLLAPGFYGAKHFSTALLSTTPPVLYKHFGGWRQHKAWRFAWIVLCLLLLGLVVGTAWRTLLDAFYVLSAAGAVIVAAMLAAYILCWGERREPSIYTIPANGDPTRSHDPARRYLFRRMMIARVMVLLHSLTLVAISVSAFKGFPSWYFTFQGVGVWREIIFAALLFALVALMLWNSYLNVFRPLFEIQEKRHRWSQIRRPTSTPDTPDDPDPRIDVDLHRAVSQMTSTTFVAKWLRYQRPTLVVWVNLGFDDLSIRSVVQSALVNLRQCYAETYDTIRSRHRAVQLTLVLLLATGLTILLSNSWFKLPGAVEAAQVTTIESSKHCVEFPFIYNGKEWSIPIDRSKFGQVPDIMCAEELFDLMHVMYMPLVTGTFERIGEAKVIGFIFPHYDFKGFVSAERVKKDGASAQSAQEGDASAQPAQEGDASAQPAQEADASAELAAEKPPVPPTDWQVKLRLYHVALFAAIFVLLNILLSRLGPFPYRENVRRMDQLLDSMSGQTTRSSRREMWKPALWIHSLFGPQDERTVNTPPLDDRVIETAFISILRNIAEHEMRTGLGWRFRVSLPAPEVTFVFDELDKFWSEGGRGAATSGVSPSDAESMPDEKRRSRATIRLLSDLKRVVTDAPARFIFVGGRLLHDEWLADLHARHQMLSSIFDSEIYVPSLLTDQSRRLLRPEGSNVYLDDMVRIYVKSRWRAAVGRGILQDRWIWRHLSRDPKPETRPYQAINGVADDRSLEVWDKRSGTPLTELQQRIHLQMLYHFLTYRSLGNLKRLDQMLENMIRSRDRLHNVRQNGFQDVLSLTGPLILRVQFVSSVYRHVVAKLENQLMFRDDKMVISALNMADFLLKFHRRAFSWHNIERMDELTHIHRAPDLRELMQEIVTAFYDGFLHQVLNGMYAFRFRSEIAGEIDYISQYNEDEMAAFNFTLDESQTLKSIYELSLNNREHTNLDVISGLGELYEFDQEYDTARQHYLRAIRVADNKLRHMMGEPELPVLQGDCTGGGVLGEALAGAATLLPLSWALIRLRLMLQVGMTFEQSNNLERAEAEYTIAYQLSLKLMETYIPGWEGADRQQDDDLVTRQQSEFNSLKHASLLYQPLFALAWAAEKQTGDIDTSTTIVEQGLAVLRRHLPFVREKDAGISSFPAGIRHSNFALIAADLHNKAGDLYFRKGRQTIAPKKAEVENRKGDNRHSNSPNAEEENNQREGYLLRAHHHYCVSLHELRRYMQHRRISSVEKYHITRHAPTLDGRLWPVYVYRAAANTLNDMADAMVARVSLVSLLGNKDAFQGQEEWDKERAPLWHSFREWFSEDKDEGNVDVAILIENGTKCHKMAKLSDWIGTWKGAKDKPVKFTSGPHKPEQRLVMALSLSEVAALYREDAGDARDAAAELIMTARAATSYLWWLALVHSDLWTVFTARAKLEPWEELQYTDMLPWLAETALRALEKAARIYELVNRQRFRRQFSVGDGVPVEALTAACSLAMVLNRLDPITRDKYPAEQKFRLSGAGKKVKDLIISWTTWSDDAGPCSASAQQGHKDPVRYAENDEFAGCLVSVLRIFRYPVLNRLHGMQAIIFSDALAKYPDPAALRKNADALLGLSDRYRAPHLFTYMQLGQPLALAALRLRQIAETKRTLDSEQQPWPGPELDMERNARRMLRRSLESFTLGRAYYDSLSTKYYLYDDFNDRYTHFCHGMEMAGREVSGHLHHILSRLGKDEAGS